MEKYLKIGNLFDGGIGFSVRHTNEQVRAGTHAINRHDELVAEVERLTEFCESFSKFCEGVSDFMNHPSDENSYWKSYQDYKKEKSAS